MKSMHHIINAENQRDGVAEFMEKLGNVLNESKGFVLFGIVRGAEGAGVVTMLGGTVTEEMTVQFAEKSMDTAVVLHKAIKKGTATAPSAGPSAESKAPTPPRNPKPHTNH